MNTATFLENPNRYLDGSYEQFVLFGGPCVYFHEQCLRAGADDFLSHRHVEMLYATLTAWGMHRMGDAKTKLVSWDQFSESLLKHKTLMEPLRAQRMMDLSEAEYLEAVDRLRVPYCALKVSISEASIVANSKALFHVLPELIPPIDRQYTWRFFHAQPDRWRDSKGKYRAIQLPRGLEVQFDAFRDTCFRIKRLADAIGRATIEAERQRYGVTPPKAIDNAIMNYIKVHGRAHGHNRPVGFCGCDALQRRQPPHNPSPRFSPAWRDFGPKAADQAAARNGAVISGGGSETLAKAGRDRNPFADSA